MKPNYGAWLLLLIVLALVLGAGNAFFYTMLEKAEDAI
jgi:hypothetical protein